jgi:hypothetical protein
VVQEPIHAESHLVAHRVGFTDSGVTSMECPDCGRTRSLTPVKGVLRFPPHEPRKMQIEVKGKRWSTTGKTDWDVAGRIKDERTQVRYTSGGENVARAFRRHSLRPVPVERRPIRSRFRRDRGT